MFEQAQRGSGRTIGVIAGVLAASAGGLWWSAPSSEGWWRGLDRVVAGVDPRAPSFAASPVGVYPESPLALALRLEGALGPSAVDEGVAWADGVADEMGQWLMLRTGRADRHEAEAALWAAGDVDAFAVELARLLRERDVYLRKQKRLGAEGPVGRPVYLHPDEVVWVGAHVAWRLELDVSLVDSPVHQYLLWRDPGSDRARTVDLTCFRRVDDRGALQPSEEYSVGRRLVGPADHYPSGAGGIRHEAGVDADDYRAVEPAGLRASIVRRLRTWSEHPAVEPSVWEEE